MLRILALLLLAAACGSKAAPATTPRPVGNNGATSGSTASFWDVLARKGASWKLVDELGEGTTITATVTDVIAREGGREIRLSWKTETGEEDPGPPSVILVSAEGLFVDHLFVVDEPPVEIEGQTQANGRYVSFRDLGEKTICFGFGPAPDADECEDVCFQEMCVGETAGIVRLDGLWSRDYLPYTAAER